MLSVVLVSGAGAAGYLVGQSEASGDQEAETVESDSFEAAFKDARVASAARSAQKGNSEGLAAGRESGGRAGTTDANTDATRDIERQQAEIAAAEAAEAAEAAALAAEQEVYCPLAADNYLTQAECDALGAEEARCGGYDPDQVQPDGSYLPKPGC